MTAAALRVLANELDDRIQELDRFIFRAKCGHVSDKLLEWDAMAIAHRNDLVSMQGFVWGTRPVGDA